MGGCDLTFLENWGTSKQMEPPQSLSEVTSTEVIQSDMRTGPEATLAKDTWESDYISTGTCQQTNCLVFLTCQDAKYVPKALGVAYSLAQSFLGYLNEIIRSVCKNMEAYGYSLYH